jgi:hypothetical protein
MSADDSNQYDPVEHKYLLFHPDAMFIVVLFMACIVVQRIFARPGITLGNDDAKMLLGEMLMSAFFALTMRLRIGNRMKKGEISPSFAKHLCIQLVMLLLVINLAFNQFLSFVPR